MKQHYQTNMLYKIQIALKKRGIKDIQRHKRGIFSCKTDDKSVWFIPQSMQPKRIRYIKCRKLNFLRNAFSYAPESNCIKFSFQGKIKYGRHLHQVLLATIPFDHQLACGTSIYRFLLGRKCIYYVIFSLRGQHRPFKSQMGPLSM